MWSGAPRPAAARATAREKPTSSPLPMTAQWWVILAVLVDLKDVDALPNLGAAVRDRHRLYRVVAKLDRLASELKPETLTAVGVPCDEVGDLLASLGSSGGGSQVVEDRVLCI